MENNIQNIFNFENFQKKFHVFQYMHNNNNKYKAKIMNALLIPNKFPLKFKIIKKKKNKKIYKIFLILSLKYF